MGEAGRSQMGSRGPAAVALSTGVLEPHFYRRNEENISDFFVLHREITKLKLGIIHQQRERERERERELRERGRVWRRRVRKKKIRKSGRGLVKVGTNGRIGDDGRNDHEWRRRLHGTRGRMGERAIT